MSTVRKIINDPVHGFITIDHPLILQVISHPWYQRLRNIHQMAFAHLVYPGAKHSRLHHSLGAYHLMRIALNELKSKGTEITAEEELGAKIAILLHDIGHGPYSHALEFELLKDIHHEQILKMLIVHNGELMIEEKAIYSIEKFLVSRRLMYWQVYLHKTVLASENLLVKIIHRAKELIKNGVQVSAATDDLNFFLHQSGPVVLENHLDKFCRLDDVDVLATIKNWCSHPDKILSALCHFIVERKLLKVKLQAEPIDEKFIAEKKKEAAKQFGITEEETNYFVFTGEAVNTTYNPIEEKINILFKDGTVKDI